jgi:hypothetical protein
MAESLNDEFLKGIRLVLKEISKTLNEIRFELSSIDERLRVLNDIQESK